jgi:hypothetical protein
MLLSVGLIAMSLVTDMVVKNWWPTIAVISAMAVAGVFTGLNVLLGGDDKDEKNG